MNFKFSRKYVPQRGGMRSRNGNRRVRPKWRANNNSSKYMFSSQPQTLGVGKTTIRVTRFANFVKSSDAAYSNYNLNVMQESVASQEFVRFAQDFSYCKLKQISVVKPGSAQSATAPAFVKMDWLNGEEENIVYDDNSKMLPLTNVRAKIYNFKAPNILLEYTSGEVVKKINYSEWQSAKEIMSKSLPGTLKITTKNTVYLAVEIIWIFRGYNAKYPYTREIIFKEDNKEDNKDKEEDIKEEEDVPQEVLKAYNLVREHKEILEKLKGEN